MYSFWPTLMNVIEIEFLLNIIYSIFLTVHKVQKGKTKHEKPKDYNYETICFSYAFVSSFKTHSAVFESFCT